MSQRIAVITDAHRIAGSEIWLLNTLPRLKSLGFAAEVFMPNSRALEGFAAELERTDVPVHRFGHLRDIQTEALDDYTLRITQFWSSSSYARVLPRLPVPRVVVSHDQIHYAYPLGIAQLYDWGFDIAKLRHFRAAQAVITVSRWAGALFSKHYGLKAVYTINNGVDPKRFYPSSPQRRQLLREKHHFSRYTVLVPGRASHEKNQMASLLAAKAAKEMDFVFVGDFDSIYGTMIRGTAGILNLSNVQFLSRSSEMDELYQAADAMLQPTLAENQSLVTLEAMASGVPVVSSSIPAQTELIEHNIQGLCVGVHPAKLVAALRSLADAPGMASRLARGARDKILEVHTLEQSTYAFAQVLDTLTS